MKKINIKIKKIGIVILVGLSFIVLLYIAKIIIIWVEQNYENSIKKKAIEKGNQNLFIPNSKLFDKSIRYINILPKKNKITLKTMNKENLFCPNKEYFKTCQYIEKFITKVRHLDLSYIKLLPQQEIIIMEIEGSRKWEYYYSSKNFENIKNNFITITTGRKLQS